MPPRRSFWIGIALCAALVAWVAWPDGVSAAAPDEAAGGSRGRSTSDTDAPLARVLDERRAAAANRGTPTTASVLHLAIHRRDGRRASPGFVYARFFAEPPLVLGFLAPDRGYPLPQDAARVAHDGTATLHVPPGRSIWLRAVAGGGEGYLRLPALNEDTHASVTLDPTRRALHVCVLAADLTRPAAGAEVRVYASDLLATAPPRVVRTARADETGYVAFRGLAPQRFVICAPGARPGDRPPHAMPVVLPETMPIAEMPLVVVAREPTYSVQLDLKIVGLEARPGPAPKLFLRRDRDRRTFPMAGTLRPDVKQARLEVPAGEYEVDVLPLGELVLAADDRHFRVAENGPRRFELSLRANHRKTELELMGVDKRLLPVTVLPRPVGRFGDRDSDLMFAGPYHWRATKVAVPSLGEPVRVIVRSSAPAWWISEEILRLSPPRQRVQLRSATRLEVQWSGTDIRRWTSAVIDVEEGGSVRTMILRPELVATEYGSPVPALVGALVLPHGKARLTGFHGDGVKTWTRDLTLSSAVKQLQVVSSSGTVQFR